MGELDSLKTASDGVRQFSEHFKSVPAQPNQPTRARVNGERRPDAPLPTTTISHACCRTMSPL